MIRHRWVPYSILGVVLLLTAWAGTLLWSAIDEGAVPSDSDFPQIPPAGEKVQVSTQCGSGGCWREMVVEAEPPETPESLGAAMGLVTERCRPVNLWTLRKTCSGIASSTGGDLSLYLRYSPLISKY
ncbi:hypothetical protein Achl_3398 [Pseudarthrobacter chlorophenolicus A6]|uniref:Uncharacterized protein n=1 Tax=Pseudarthrobacter chlorophenolicus (strain ATCC 700700 / DSM 12829 / CIP 107037 / JCM 12360 / KCTC 9906 / NCIMB 13794 / A6) TaxID=452863 RepID=B8HGT9_PSECP|nr:hypothetical protein [Pseudarthrobacter chlorophenolicus]ACL41355.1 hypothetical protein Achl_3398 [Pseudarthrobacter chlorophenolicus A6]SDQ65607.1 hypothetical protein SAMN04489738_2081 [Pseudarthrobacter chlorophenolicus]